MVAINAYTWVVFTTGTSGNVLYGTSLNYPFMYVSAMVNKGITGANIANGGIDAGALIAANIVTHGHLSFAANGGVKLLQIGKSTAVTGQFIANGVATAAINTLTNTDVTVYFTNGEACTSGEPVYTAAPSVYVTCVYATPTTAPTITLKSVATNNAVINVDAYGTSTMTEEITLKWLAIGKV
jgi:hypothetical protein